MWIVCQADDSHVMSSFISSENYVEHALKMSSASRDCRFKGYPSDKRSWTDKEEWQVQSRDNFQLHP